MDTAKGRSARSHRPCGERRCPRRLAVAEAFFDITTGNNDLAGVGCCQATVGYDLASGLGVPDWAVLPATLPPPG
jgi:hypothetical protein